MAQDLVVTRETSRLGRVAVYTVWEPVNAESLSHEGTAIRLPDGQPGVLYAKYVTRRLPQKLAKMRSGPKRQQRVSMWQQKCYDEAYAIILDAYPHLATVGKRARYSLGSIDEYRF